MVGSVQKNDSSSHNAKVRELSRASDLRDAIKNELSSTFSNVVVRSSVDPTFDFESSETNEFCVWLVSRQIEALQGASRRRVSVNITFAGHGSLSQAITESSRQVESLAVADAFDGIIETAIGLFSPNGTFFRGVHCGHRFESIEQPEFFDVELWRTSQIWQSQLIVNFLDILDE